VKRGDERLGRVFASGGLSVGAQRGAFAALTTLSRLGLQRRTAPLPPVGKQDHLTAVLRIGPSAVPNLDVSPRHYVYPPEAVHVTVANLDRAGAPLDDAIVRLSRTQLVAPVFWIDEVGCSPDTLLLRCIHDHRFVRLREAVEIAFEVSRPWTPLSWIFRRLTFANVVRFNGPGEWIHEPSVERQVRCTTLEIVRTDRYLSPSGTTVVEAISLHEDS